jgi:bifunctional non-homologous end joining protein LigD
MSLEISANLFNKKNGSDKVYNAYLRASGDGWVVDYSNGRSGSTLATGTKTITLVSYEVALKTFNKLVSSKISGGYEQSDQSDASSTYTSSADAGETTGLNLQLLTSIDEISCHAYLRDDRFSAQLKANGERRAIIVENGEMCGSNRKGLKVNVPQKWIIDAAYFGNVVIDGEQIGDDFFAFDMLKENETDLKSLPFSERYERLKSLYFKQDLRPAWFKLLDAKLTTSTKLELLKLVVENQLEGIVFQNLTSTYQAGRNSESLKYKLVENATCIVYGLNSQRSVVVGMLNEANELKSYGNVAIPANHDVPVVGDLIEIRYLYFTGQAFEQPLYLGKRLDLHKLDANILQITRRKPELENV